MTPLTKDARAALCCILGCLGCLALARFTPSIRDEPAPAPVQGHAAGADALREGRAIDVNAASREDLQLLPGIGPSLAGRIVDFREQHGAFGSAAELRGVKGIGRKLLAKLSPFLAFGSEQVVNAAPSELGLEGTLAAPVDQRDPGAQVQADRPGARP